MKYPMDQQRIQGKIEVFWLTFYKLLHSHENVYIKRANWIVCVWTCFHIFFLCPQVKRHTLYGCLYPCYVRTIQFYLLRIIFPDGKWLSLCTVMKEKMKENHFIFDKWWHWEIENIYICICIWHGQRKTSRE